MAVYVILGVLIAMFLISRVTSGGSRTTLRRTARHRNDGGIADSSPAAWSGSDGGTSTAHAGTDCASSSDSGGSDGGCSSDGGGGGD